MGATVPLGNCHGDALKVKRWWMDKERRWLRAEAGHKTMSCTWIIVLVQEEDAWSGAAAPHHTSMVSLRELSRIHQDGIISVPRTGDNKTECLEVVCYFKIGVASSKPQLPPRCSKFRLWVDANSVPKLNRLLNPHSPPPPALVRLGCGFLSICCSIHYGSGSVRTELRWLQASPHPGHHAAGAIRWLFLIFPSCCRPPHCALEPSKDACLSDRSRG